MRWKSSVVAVLAGLSLSAYPSTRLPACDADSGGISLPAGFCAVVVADQVGAPRHLAIAPNGDVFVAQKDRKSTRLNSSHITISYAVFCLKKKKKDCERN